MASVPALPPAPPPDLAAILKALVVNSVNSRESKRAYVRGVDEFLKWCDTYKPTGFTKATVQSYRSHLVESGAGTIHSESPDDHHPPPGRGNGRQPPARTGHRIRDCTGERCAPHFAPHDLRRSYAKLAHKGARRWSRFSCRLAMHQFRRQKGIWAPNRILPMHPVTTWG